MKTDKFPLEIFSVMGRLGFPGRFIESEKTADKIDIEVAIAKYVSPNLPDTLLPHEYSANPIANKEIRGAP